MYWSARSMQTEVSSSRFTRLVLASYVVRWSVSIKIVIVCACTRLEGTREGFMEPDRATCQNGSVTFPRALAADDFDVGKVARLQEPVCQVVSCQVTCQMKSFEVKQELVAYSRSVALQSSATATFTAISSEQRVGRYGMRGWGEIEWRCCTRREVMFVWWQSCPRCVRPNK